jgi:hypothetical protein
VQADLALYGVRRHPRPLGEVRSAALAMVEWGRPQLCEATPMARHVTSSGPIGELLLGVGSMWLARVVASSAVGVWCLVPLAPSSVEWCRLEVMVVVSVTDGGARMVLHERGGLGGANAGSGCSAPGLRQSWHGGGCRRLVWERSSSGHLVGGASTMLWWFGHNDVAPPASHTLSLLLFIIIFESV